MPIASASSSARAVSWVTSPRSDPLGGVDQRWLEMCRLVLAEHTEASRLTQELVLLRVSARLAAGHGDGIVPEPGRRHEQRAWLRSSTTCCIPDAGGRFPVDVFAHADRLASYLGVPGTAKPQADDELDLRCTARLATE